MLAEGIERGETRLAPDGPFSLEDGQLSALGHVERALAADGDLVLARRCAALIYALGRQEQRWHPTKDWPVCSLPMRVYRLTVSCTASAAIGQRPKGF